MKAIAGYVSLPVILVSLHRVLTQTYSSYCAPRGISGYLMSFITVASPLCVTNLTLLTKTAEFYQQIWMLLTFWSVGLVGVLYRKMTDKIDDGEKKTV